MKSILIKIIFGFCIVISMNACHSFDHKNIFIHNINKNSNKELLDKENKTSKFTVNKSTNNSEMAPIDMPKQKERVQKLALQKQIKTPKAKYFSLDKLVNWNEEKLVKTFGSSHFIKEEGKLKNYQYHFKECFLDIFLLKKNEIYLVNYIETRPTKLNGTINIKACNEVITQILN
jgi:hypothetical protein